MLYLIPVGEWFLKQAGTVCHRASGPSNDAVNSLGTMSTWDACIGSTGRAQVKSPRAQALV